MSRPMLRYGLPGEEASVRLVRVQETKRYFFNECDHRANLMKIEPAREQEFQQLFVRSRNACNYTLLDRQCF